MPISDYANAFFFARRNRVTPQRRSTRARELQLPFQNRARATIWINTAVAVANLFRPVPWIRARKNTGAQKGRTAQTRGRHVRKKEKARHQPGFPKNCCFSISSFRQLGDRMCEPRNFPTRIVLVNDIALRCLHQFRLRARHRLQRGIAITAADRLFDNADRTAHLGAARLVDDGAAGNLARRLLGGSSIGHVLKYPSAVTGRYVVGLSAPAVEPRDRRWCVFPVFCENATLWKRICSHEGVAQSTAAAGLRPPPLPVL